MRGKFPANVIVCAGLDNVVPTRSPTCDQRGGSRGRDAGRTLTNARRHLCAHFVPWIERRYRTRGDDQNSCDEFWATRKRSRERKWIRTLGRHARRTRRPGEEQCQHPDPRRQHHRSVHKARTRCDPGTAPRQTPSMGTPSGGKMPSTQRHTSDSCSASSAWTTQQRTIAQGAARAGRLTACEELARHHGELHHGHGRRAGDRFAW